MNHQERQAVSAGRTRERGKVPARTCSTHLEKSCLYFYFTCSEAVSKNTQKNEMSGQRGKVPAIFPRAQHTQSPAQHTERKPING